MPKQSGKQYMETEVGKKDLSFKVFYFSVSAIAMIQPCVFQLSNGRIGVLLHAEPEKLLL